MQADGRITLADGTPALEIKDGKATCLKCGMFVGLVKNEKWPLPPDWENCGGDCLDGCCPARTALLTHDHRKVIPVGHVGHRLTGLRDTQTEKFKG